MLAGYPQNVGFNPMYFCLIIALVSCLDELRGLMQSTQAFRGPAKL
jgi:hypothetical protein